MGLFNFGKKKTQPATPAETPGGIPRPEVKSFDDLLARHAALSFEKQMLFGQLIGERNWQFDMQAGTISFGEDLTFPVQFIGSLAFGDMSYLWGWGNAQSNIPDSLLKAGNALKAYGESMGIEELSTRSYKVNEGFHHQVGMIACGYTGARAYYCGNYGGGILVATMDDTNIPSPNLENLGQVLMTFPQVIQSVDVDHRKALIHYLHDRNCLVTEEGDKIVGQLGTVKLTGTFDDIGRLTNLGVG